MVREERYVTFKLKDFKYLEDSDCQAAVIYLENLKSLLDTVECVVIEADWPEYEKVWKMIEERVDSTETL